MRKVILIWSNEAMRLIREGERYKLVALGGRVLWVGTSAISEETARSMVESREVAHA